MSDDDDMPSKRWQRLALGQCSEEEQEELRASDAERFNLYKPLSKEERDRIYRRVIECVTLDHRVRVVRKLLTLVIAASAILMIGWCLGSLSPFTSIADAAIIIASRMVGTLAMSSIVMFALFRRFW